MAGTTISADPLHAPQSQQPTPFTFSAEDRKIIQECNNEAFFQRCLPLATCLGGLTYLAVKAGYWRSGSWGATPKVIGAVFTGYFVGKLSYQQTCAEKLMANPNSPLGAILRARRQQGRGGFQDSLALDMPGYSLPSFSEDKPRDIYQDDLSTRTFTDLDTDRPAYSLQTDDAYRYSFDSNPQRPEDFVLPPQSTQSNTYDEMRRRNRDEFENKKNSFYSTSRPVEEASQYQPPRPSPSADLLDPYRPTNAYGDVFDK